MGSLNYDVIGLGVRSWQLPYLPGLVVETLPYFVLILPLGTVTLLLSSRLLTFNPTNIHRVLNR